MLNPDRWLESEADRHEELDRLDDDDCSPTAAEERAAAAEARWELENDR